MRLAWQEQTGQGNQTDGLTVPDEEWTWIDSLLFEMCSQLW